MTVFVHIVLIVTKSFAVDSMEPFPLMEGEGRSLRVLGFNQNQRAAFVQIMMRLSPLPYQILVL